MRRRRSVTSNPATALGVAVAVAAALLVTTAVPARASVAVRCAPNAPSIAAGGLHSLLLDATGALRAAGSNALGQLGDGTLTTRTSPVATLELAELTTVAGGGEFSLALRADGTVWAWGMNWFGQLGNGEMGQPLREVEPQRAQGVGEAVAIAAGADHSLALTEDGTVYAWGHNQVGQLGVGNTLDSPVPLQVSGLADVVAIAAGAYHSLAVTSGGDVYTWGDNADGQLGFGYADWAPHVTPAKVPGLTGVTAVAGGGEFSLALKSDGTVFAWGYNDVGSLGVGVTAGEFYSPTQVVDLTDVKAIAAGSWHSLALKSDGTVWAWGWSNNGQLGNGWYGSGAFTPTRVQVSGLSAVAAIAGGGNHSLAVRSAGTVHAWGRNAEGQLGLGDTTDRTTPQTVSTVSQATPAAPTAVEAVAGEALALVTWQAPESVVTQYVVTPYRNGVAQAPVGTKLPKLEYAVPSLVEGDTYWFEVQAQNCLGDGAVSSASNRVVPTGVQLHDEGFSLERQRINDRHGLKVNVYNGNLKVDASDLAIAGRGLSLGIERVYNSRADSTGVFGNDWTTTVGTDVSLEPLANGSVFLHAGDGSQRGFALRDDGVNYDPPSGLDATLTKLADGSYTLRFHFSDEMWAFSAAGKLLSREDRNDNTLSFTYDPVTGRLATIADTQGRTITFGYDPDGRVSQITDDPNPALARAWKYGYDAAGNLTTYTDPANQITTYAYDAAGNLTSVTTPGGGAAGTRRVEFTYDTVPRVTTVKWPQAPGAPTTAFDYQPKKTVVTDANGSDTTYETDAVGRTTKVVDALGNSVSTAYTSNSNVRRHSVGGAATSYGYTGVNALSSMHWDTGAGYTLAYDDPAHPHLPTSVEDPQGHFLRYAYDAKGNLVSQTNDHPPPDNRVDLAYNADGDNADGTLTFSEDTENHRTNYGYDTQGNLTSVDPPAPLGTVGPIGYDTLSRVTSVRDGRSNTTTYRYDALDRVTRATFADGRAVGYGYDGDGNLLTVVDATGITTMTYDERNLLTSRTTPDGKTIAYTYDGVGNLKTVTEDGRTVTYSYSAANLLSGVIEHGGAATTFNYDADYNRVAVRYPNGVSLFSTFDDAKRLTKVSALSAALETLMSFEYSYEHPTSGDDTALRQSMTDHEGNATTYTYDALNRLTKAMTVDADGAFVRDEVYRYDPRSNRTSQTIQDATTGTHRFYGYNAANQLVNDNGVATLSYDGNGNLTGSSLGEAYTYNAAGQTTSIRTAEGLFGEYTYRGASQAERASTEIGGQKLFTFGHSVLGLSSETLVGAGTTHFTRDTAGALLSQEGPTGRHYYLTDGLGSVVGLVDGQGSLAASYRYDSFGNLVASTGTGALTRLRFAGYYLDPTGLYKVGHRYYDPTVGRWTQQDPIWDPLDPKQWNRYVYVGGDPVNLVDPSGLYGWSDFTEDVSGGWESFKEWGKCMLGVIPGAIVDIYEGFTNPASGPTSFFGVGAVVAVAGKMARRYFAQQIIRDVGAFTIGGGLGIIVAEGIYQGIKC